jgi:hypothetical protein
VFGSQTVSCLAGEFRLRGRAIRVSVPRQFGMALFRPRELGTGANGLSKVCDKIATKQTRVHDLLTPEILTAVILLPSLRLKSAPWHMTRPLHIPEIECKDTLQEIFATAALIREVEQRLLELFAAGKLFGTVHTCIGQEIIGIAIARGLVAGDQIFSNHRCRGHFLARTGNVDGLIAEVMGRETGVCGGRGGSQHLCDVDKGFFSNGIQGGIMPVTAGLSLALQIRESNNLAVVSGTERLEKEPYMKPSTSQANGSYRC